MAKLESKNKDTMRLVKAARKAGWIVTKTNSNHLKFVPPSQNLPITILCSTPGGSADFQRNLERFRKWGVKI